MEERKKIIAVLSVTTLASFLAGFNARLAVVGLPTIAGDIKADIWSIVWIIQGFMLGSTVFQLIIGRLSDQYGRVKIFLIGIGIFTIGAFLSGISPNPKMLIMSRLGTWLGVNQIAWRVGALLGLTLSGFIIDLLGWQWIFLVQVPIGIAVLLWSRGRLPESYVAKESKELDVLGFSLFTVFLTLILIGFTMLGYGYRDASLSFLLLSLVFLASFTYVELRRENPALDLRLFKIWQFTGGIISQLLYAIGYGASLTLLAIYMQSVMGYSPSYTGVLLVPYELSFLVFGLVGGNLSDRIGYVPVTTSGLAIGSISLLFLGEFSSLNMIIVSEILLGVGTGLFVSPNTSSVMTSVPPQRRGVASSIRNISFNVGFVLSLNVAVLTMTRFLPYEMVSHLIVLGGTSQGGGNIALELDSLGKAIRQSYIVQSIIMALAIPFSLGRSRKGSPKDR
jgi:MFS family permease